MTMTFVWIMVSYSLGMACGQVLFKLAARSSLQVEGSSGLLAYINIYLLLGMALYVGLSVLWVWILRSIPLSKAYPFVALAFVFTPLLARLIFDEKLSSGYFVGLGFVAVGIIVIARY